MKWPNSYIIIIAFYLILGWILYILKPEIVNSNFFFASVTFVVGCLAIYIYTEQKKDEKTNAAISILFEIRNAEEQVSIILERLNQGGQLDLPAVLQTNSWQKYSHLFAKEFDLDEFKAISDFYNTCDIIEDLVERQNNFVWFAAEERAKTAQRLLGEINLEFQRDIFNQTHTPETAQQKFNAERESITKYYTDDGYFYAPQKCLDGLRLAVSQLQKLTITTLGSKLKKIANFK
ncbi:hypothetical protein SAMN04488505_102704 [Chitinophaga rupis]|uniref:Uncharacterized protein n=1 Tax=Chitinophaga rupis TaxID=573321 RepID=A0A1H7RQC2_9BACT|nr:hypothetical protein [Chitinophaga rupis]SEL62436.1 hypothetical protein SAMN04488505_102704 [Chitinophaga rupis]